MSSSFPRSPMPQRPRSIGKISALKSSESRCYAALDWAETLFDRGEHWTWSRGIGSGPGFRWFFSELAAEVFAEPSSEGRLCVEIPLGRWISNEPPPGWHEFAQTMAWRSPGWSLGTAGVNDDQLVLRATVPLARYSTWWLCWARWMLPMVADEAHQIAGWLSDHRDRFAPAIAEHPVYGVRSEPSRHVRAIANEAKRARKVTEGFTFPVDSVFLTQALLNIDTSFASRVQSLAPLEGSSFQLYGDGEMQLVGKAGTLVRSSNEIHPTFGPGLRFVVLTDTADHHNPLYESDPYLQPELVPFYRTHLDPDLTVKRYNAAPPTQRSPAVWAADSDNVVFAHFFMPASVLAKADTRAGDTVGLMLTDVVLTLLRNGYDAAMTRVPDSEVTEPGGPVNGWTAPIAGWD